MSVYMAVCVLCAYVVKGLCGFANTLVFSSLLSFRANNNDISPIDLLLGYPANGLMAWRERKSLNARVWLPLSALVIAGCIPGTMALRYLTADTQGKELGEVIVIDREDSSETCIDSVPITWQHPCHPHPQLYADNTRVSYTCLNGAGRMCVKVALLEKDGGHTIK